MKFVAALLVVFGTVAAARADAGPPPGWKPVPVTTIVEVTEDFPDYAFFEILWSPKPGAPNGETSRAVTLHFFVPGTTVSATRELGSGGRLYVVPRSIAEGVPGWKELAAEVARHNPPKYVSAPASDEQWLAIAQSVENRAVPGATATRFGGSEQSDRSGITETYRVVRTPTGVKFDRVSEPRSSFPWKWVGVGVIAGVAAFMAFVLGGMWLVWRLARNASDNNATRTAGES